MIPTFRATVADIGGRIALVSVSGELDLYVESDLRAALQSAADLETPTVLVDLSGVSFMDSTACGVLVAEARQRARYGSDFAVVSNGNFAARALGLAGIDRILPVYPTLRAAFVSLLLEPVA
ncbi:MAG TPA: STAS domain-containing protein [Gaiellaceae bacterium]|nr:STAS domain-containing protein [Gaiellaceae bacterium]